MLLPSTRRVTGIAVTLAAACLTVACGARSEIDFPLPGAGARDAGRDAGRDAFIPPVDGGRDVFVPPVDAGRDVFVPPVRRRAGRAYPSARRGRRGGVPPHSLCAGPGGVDLVVGRVDLGPGGRREQAFPARPDGPRVGRARAGALRRPRPEQRLPRRHLALERAELDRGLPRERAERSGFLLARPARQHGRPLRRRDGAPQPQDPRRHVGLGRDDMDRAAPRDVAPAAKSRVVCHAPGRGRPLRRLRPDGQLARRHLDLRRHQLVAGLPRPRRPRATGRRRWRASATAWCSSSPTSTAT